MTIGTKSFRARRAKILAEWNDGTRKADLMDKYAADERTFNSILRNAHAKGVYVRDIEPFLIKKKRVEETAHNLHRYHPEVRAPKATRKLERKSVSDRDTDWWIKRLPEKVDQCRWPSGDLANRTLRFCCRTRADAHIPLAIDTLPYCEHHRQKARRRYPQKDAPVSGEHAVQAKRGLEMA